MTFQFKQAIGVVFLLLVFTTSAQTKSELVDLLKTKDSLLFDIGFNQCDTNQLERLIAKDIEFYHDKDGITKSREKFIASIEGNLCATGKNILKRVLDKNSFEVFPLYRKGELYGAIQNGDHRFGDVLASYSHLWLIYAGEWKLARVFSYNHTQELSVSKTNRLDLTLKDLTQYIGDYEFSPEFVLTIRIKDGELYGGSQGQEVKISSYAEHRFIDDAQTHDLEFLLDKKGNITALNMKGSGMEMTGQKIVN